LSGLLLLAGGIGMLVRRSARTFALFTTAYLLSWVLLLQAPRVVQAPGNVGAWLGFCENVILMSGGWILVASLQEPGDGRRMRFLSSDGSMRFVRYLFGASCLVLGLSHFVYADATAGMVPAWLPDRLGIAYLTGACHFAAGVGILFAIFPRLAATLEAIMISSFVLLLHTPSVVSQPKDRLQWTMLCVASALAGAAWITARSLRAASWGWKRRSLEVSLSSN
jgi:uncharacterized membrane protein